MRSTQQIKDNVQMPTVSEARKSRKERKDLLSYEDVCLIKESGTGQSIEFKEFTRVRNFYVHRSYSAPESLAGRFRNLLIDLDIAFYHQTLKNPTDKDDIYHIVFVTKKDFKKWPFKLAENISSINEQTNTSSTRTTSTFSAASNNNDITATPTENLMLKPTSTLNDFSSTDLARRQHTFITPEYTGADPTSVSLLHAINYGQRQFTNMMPNMEYEQTLNQLVDFYSMQPPYLPYDQIYQTYGYHFIPPQPSAYDQTASSSDNANTQTESSISQFSNNVAATSVASNPHALFSSKPIEGEDTHDLQSFLAEADQIDTYEPMIQEMLAELISGMHSGKTNPAR